MLGDCPKSSVVAFRYNSCPSSLLLVHHRIHTRSFPLEMLQRQSTNQCRIQRMKRRIFGLPCPGLSFNSMSLQISLSRSAAPDKLQEMVERRGSIQSGRANICGCKLLSKNSTTNGNFGFDYKTNGLWYKLRECDVNYFSQIGPVTHDLND